MPGFDLNNISAQDKLYIKLKIDKILHLWPFIHRNYETTVNWSDILFLRIGLKKQVNASFRDGSSFDNITKQNYFDYTVAQEERVLHATKTSNDQITFDYKGQKLILNGNNAAISAFSIFSSEEYSYVNPKDKSVVDIGANIGDTIIWFALNGAKHIYAFEPYLYAFSLAKENSTVNGVLEKVTLVRAAIGSKSDQIKLSDAESFGGSELRESNEGSSVPVLTLNDVLKSYPAKDSLLKIDCEGSEYEILLNSSNETLRSFEEIILEYHYGYLDIKRKLESAGFDVKIPVKPQLHYNTYSSNPYMVIGLLYAKRC